MRRILPHSLIWFSFSISAQSATNVAKEPSTNLLYTLSFSRGWRTDRQTERHNRECLATTIPNPFAAASRAKHLPLSPILVCSLSLKRGLGCCCAVRVDWVGLPSLHVQSLAHRVSRPLTLVCSVPGKSREKCSSWRGSRLDHIHKHH